MSHTALFRPYALRGLELRNRIVVAPMCEYSAVEGSATDWHLIHLGHLALSGAGLLVIEATAVEPRGRITRECLGLYSDQNERALARVLQAVRSYSSMPIGIQLSHAGRKASRVKPSDGRTPVPQGQGDWRVIGPSAIPFANGWQTPQAMERAAQRAAGPGPPRAARRAWLPAQLLPVAHCQPAHRRLRRQRCQPHAISARAVRGGPPRVAAGQAARRALQRNRLGRARHHA
jgi:2,4-dienoyl-CoA reductase-like NADH-dependent reductase (Old Yellow Enzyme family)